MPKEAIKTEFILSFRELDVLETIKSGITHNKGIARELSIKDQTDGSLYNKTFTGRDDQRLTYA